MNVNGPSTIKIGEHITSSNYFEKLLGVKDAIQLDFNNHLEIIKKASLKVHVLARITSYMCISKRMLLVNVFFKAQFAYCSLVWMCHSRSVNSKINRLHERCPRIIYSDKTSSFVDL